MFKKSPLSDHSSHQPPSTVADNNNHARCLRPLRGAPFASMWNCVFLRITLLRFWLTKGVLTTVLTVSIPCHYA